VRNADEGGAAADSCEQSSSSWKTSSRVIRVDRLSVRDGGPRPTMRLPSLSVDVQRRRRPARRANHDAAVDTVGSTAPTPASQQPAAVQYQQIWLPNGEYAL